MIFDILEPLRFSKKLQDFYCRGFFSSHYYFPKVTWAYNAQKKYLKIQKNCIRVFFLPEDQQISSGEGQSPLQ